MPLSGKLRVHKPAVHAHLKATPVRRNQGYSFHQVLEVLEQLTCQANGPVGVVSDRTVDNLNLQHTTSGRRSRPCRTALRQLEAQGEDQNPLSKGEKC